MMLRGILQAASFCLACLALSACDVRRDPQMDVDGVAPVPGAKEYREHLARENPPPLTRQEALREYQKCIREKNSGTKGLDGRRYRASDPRTACEKWRKMAYPAPRHARTRAEEEKEGDGWSPPP
ncbi:MAG TPA: hypothetical protein VF006_29715 [Longimicrobium sp.]